MEDRDFNEVKFNEVKKRLFANLDWLIALYTERLRKSSLLRDRMNQLEERILRLEARVMTS